MGKHETLISLTHYEQQIRDIVASQFKAYGTEKIDDMELPYIDYKDEQKFDELIYAELNDLITKVYEQVTEPLKSVIETGTKLLNDLDYEREMRQIEGKHDSIENFRKSLKDFIEKIS